MKIIALALIRLYQKGISPLLGPCCRFYPSCSEYTYKAMERHGFFKGFFLGAKRLLKCGPWHKGGHDPVP